MKLAVYVNYPGNCEEAFRFYERHLDAKLDGVIRRHEEMPNPGVPPEWGAKVLHARLEIGSTVLMGADIPRADPMRSSYLTLFLDSDGEADRIYSALAEGGEVFMELQTTPFASRFAMLRDRFGASWMLLHQPISHDWYMRPVLFVTDIQRALGFYVEKLGFEKKWHEADGTGKVCQVERSGCEIILCEDSTRRDRGRLFLELSREGVEQLVREAAENSVVTERSWWGYEVLRIDDPDGNELLVCLEW